MMKASHTLLLMLLYQCFCCFSSFRTSIGGGAVVKHTGRGGVGNSNYPYGHGNPYDGSSDGNESGGLMRGQGPDSAEQMLVHELLLGYVRQGRPVLRYDTNITVQISLYLQQITNLDEREQVLISRGWLYVEWLDELLTWDPNEYDGAHYINLYPNDIWTPELAVGNSVRNVFDKSYEEIRLVVLNNGTVIWFPGGVFYTACTIQIFYFPFDDQKCSIIIQQWTTVRRTVDFMNSSAKVFLSEYTTNGEWEIAETSSWKHHDEYPLGAVGQIYFDIYLRRKSLFVMINIIVPCLMISTLSFMVFYLVPESGEKITLGTTVLLSYIVFLLLIAEIVPQNSDTVPLLTVYLTVLMAMTTISVMLSVFVLRIHHHDSSTPTGPIFRLIYKIVSRVIAPIVNIRRRSGFTETESQMDFSPDGLNACEPEEGSPLWRPKNHHFHHNNLSEIDESPTTVTSNHSTPARSNNPHYKRRPQQTTSSRHRRYHRSKFMECIENEKMKYRFIAMVCDRLLLVLFLLANIAIALLFLVIVPMSKVKPHIYNVPSHMHHDHYHEGAESE